jgi:hypothetical protein
VSRAYDAIFTWKNSFSQEIHAQVNFPSINVMIVYELFPHQFFILLDYSCYRDYVIVALPQLKILDGNEITRTERFQAQRNFKENRHHVIQQQVLYEILLSHKLMTK